MFEILHLRKFTLIKQLFELGNRFLNTTPKVQAMIMQTDKLDFITMKHFCKKKTRQ